ncbi:unnamed protein product [Somion occarium]|uniref:Uncharacterized protein n=1 Tax=Somion occarium TaxID=3059160 RepID=A0ABP1CSJ8_9APHY
MAAYVVHKVAQAVFNQLEPQQYYVDIAQSGCHWLLLPSHYASCPFRHRLSNHRIVAARDPIIQAGQAEVTSATVVADPNRDDLLECPNRNRIDSKEESACDVQTMTLQFHRLKYSPS